jgi:hypothetical protein
MPKAILELPEKHTLVLSLLLEKVPPTEHMWALTGSAGLRLQYEKMGRIQKAMLIRLAIQKGSL